MRAYLVLIFLILAVIGTYFFITNKEKYVTYVMAPDLRASFQTDLSLQRASYNQPMPYENVDGTYPDIISNGSYPPFDPYIIRENLNNEDDDYNDDDEEDNNDSEIETFVGAESERDEGSCVNNKFQQLNGYPQHGFVQKCDLEFPKDVALSPDASPETRETDAIIRGWKSLGLNVPMVLATKSDKNYEIGAWVHAGKGIADDGETIDVYQFNIDPANNLFRYSVQTKNGDQYMLTFDPNRYGLEDGYRFEVNELNKVFLFRKDYEFPFAWR